MKEPTMLQKFATQVDDKILETLRTMAREDGKKIQALIGEALVDYINRRMQGYVRPQVMSHHQQSAAQFGDVYKRLLKRN